MPFFTGEFEQTIDAKRRMAICSALRSCVDPEDGEGFYLVLGSRNRLWLYPNRYWQRLATGLRSAKVSPEQVRQLFATAREVRPDAQGRVVLPEESLRRANVSGPVVLVGALDHIEIWPLDDWKLDQAQHEMDFQDLLTSTANTLAESGGSCKQEQ